MSYENYVSYETGAYVKFMLSVNTDCKKCNDKWSMKYHHKSDKEKYFGFKKKGMDAFF